MRRLIIVVAVLAAIAFLSSLRSDTAPVRLGSILISTCLLGGAAILWRGRHSAPSIPDFVTFGEEEVSHTGHGGIESISWNELSGVDILTTSAGPWHEDVFLLLLDQESHVRCTIPQASQGFQLLLERLLALPQFDTPAFISAMGSTSDRRFTCWRRAPAA
jgi:hypothetical protein